jgi:hypothetical protein
MIPLAKVETLKPYIQVFNTIATRLNKSRYEYKYEYKNSFCKFYIVIPLDSIIQLNSTYPNLIFEKSYLNIYPQEPRITFCFKSENMAVLLDLKPIPSEFLPENIANTLEKILDLDRFIFWNIKKIIKEKN